MYFFFLRFSAAACWIMISSIIFTTSLSASLCSVIVFGLALFAFVCPVNEEASSWLLSELADRQWKIRLIQPALQPEALSVGKPIFDGKQRLTNPKSIDLGDYIRKRDENAVVESQSSVALDSQPPRIAPVYYYRVIAKSESPHSGRIKIGMFGDELYDADPADPHDMFIRWSTKLPRESHNEASRSAAVASALSDLIDLLPDSGEGRFENYLAMELINKRQHLPSSVRLAIRIAQSGKLITCNRRRAAYFIETFNILRPNVTVQGHASCVISLTELGSTWKRARPRGHEEDFPPADQSQPSVSVYGILSTGSGATNTIHSPVWQSFQESNAAELVRELTLLCEALKKEATDFEHDIVIGELAAALVAARQGDTQNTMTNLSKLGKHAADLSKWVLNTATSIGVEVAAARIKQALGIPPG
jgi:hypothetical protein